MSFSLDAIAQGEWNWGKDRGTCEDNYRELDANVRAQKFEEAHKNLVYLLKEAPNLNKGLYMHAYQVYQSLEAVEKDPKRKQELQDSVMIMCNTRIKLYGEENEVLTRYIGPKAYSYYSTREDKKEELYPIYKKIYDLNGVNTYACLLYTSPSPRDA